MPFREHGLLVTEVKADLVRRGFDLSGACGAFAITKRVAWLLREEGGGLLDKQFGENCGGFAVGIVMYPDGMAFDMLVDAGGENVPAWNQIDAIDPARYRPAIDPGDGRPAPLPAPDPPRAPLPGEPGHAIDLSEVLIDGVERILNGMIDVRDSLDALTVQVRTLREQGVRLRLR